LSKNENEWQDTEQNFRGLTSFLIVSSQFQILVEGLPQQAQAGAIKKSSYFEREASEIDTKIENEVKKNLFSKLIFLYLDTYSLEALM
jgi:hypothetical protein